MQFLRDPTASDGIVFYSEGEAYAPFLRPVINALADVYDGPIHYLTSDVNDSVLIDDRPDYFIENFIAKGHNEAGTWYFLSGTVLEHFPNNQNIMIKNRKIVRRSRTHTQCRSGFEKGYINITVLKHG